MVKLTVLYPTPADPRAFDAYSFGTHVPIADTIPGLLRNEVSKVTGTLDGGPIDYYLQAELYFESTDAAMAALGSPEGAAAAADMANFAPDGARMVLADVVKEG